MYRIFCESYENFKNTFYEENYRLDVAKPLELIANLDEYEKEKEENTDKFKKVCDLIYFMENNILKFPKFKAFLWTLDSRNIKSKNYGVAKKEDLEEQSKLINSFLKLAYWY